MSEATAWTQKIPRHASKAERASVGTAPSVTAGARTAAPIDDQGEHNRPEQRVQVVVSPVQQLAEGVERDHRRGGHRQQQRVESQLVRTCAIRCRGRHHEPDRNRLTRHAGGFCVRPSPPSLPSANP